MQNIYLWWHFFTVLHLRHTFSTPAISFPRPLTGLSSTCPLCMRLARLRWLSVQSMTSLTRTETGHQTTCPFMCEFLFYYRNNGVKVQEGGFWPAVFITYFYSTFCSCTCSSSNSVRCPWWVFSSSLWALAASNLVLLPLVETNLVSTRLENYLTS